MRTHCKLLLAPIFLLLAHAALSQTPDSTRQSPPNSFQNPIVVTDGDSVKNYTGQIISITGPIVNTNRWEGKDGFIGFLEMFKKWPDNPFSITIYRQSLAFFEPIEQYKDKKVRVIGEVNKFKDKRTGNDRFSIVLKKLEQIEIVD